MKWSDQYATGVESIDEQHKMLFKMSEDYRAALDQGQGERLYSLLLESLHTYARAHFAFEEQCMHRYQCPVWRENEDAHAKFLTAMAGFGERYADWGFEAEDAQQLVEFLDEWLANHIARIDVQLKPAVEGSKL